MTTCLLALFRIADRIAHLCIGALALACVVAHGKKVEVKRNLVYATKDNLDLKLDAYLPAGKGPFPSVVVIHGGGWMSGSKRQLGRWAAELAKKQINAFAISYRLAPKFKHPAQLEDCRDAVRWIRKKSGEFNTDPSRIGALGYSAGAHLACMMAVTGMDAKDDPEGIGTDVLVAVGGGSPCEFRNSPADNKTLAYWLGGARKDFPEAYHHASPLAHLDREDSPILFFHGETDFLVRIDGARTMHAKMRKLGIESEFHPIKEAGHFKAIFNAKALGASFDFLERHLRKK
ncbi:MAG TPA: alpha/beta hydrolase [Opitutae bacterium]|nr:alpha/beta hydrolase [Opitutae bacterium]|tara:strand:+ start:962 stop:1828 length:867 start_codon:yes stop_codon:yes gene_type:complete